MNKIISFSTGEFKVEKTSAWLVSFLKFAEQISIFEPLKKVSMKMKEIKYTVQAIFPPRICLQRIYSTFTTADKPLRHLLKPVRTLTVKNLRTRCFLGIYGFLWMVFITHNLISWMKATVFAGTKFGKLCVSTIVRKFDSIMAEVTETDNHIEVSLPSLSRLARLFVDALKPWYIQM